MNQLAAIDVLATRIHPPGGALKAPKPTAQERQAKRQQAAAEAAAEQKRLDEEFLAHRATRWIELWAKALEVRLLLEKHPNIESTHAWASQNFRVDLDERTFSTWGCDSITEASLDRRSFELRLDELDRGLELIAAHLAEEQRLRKQREADAILRRSTFESLSDEQLRVLGLVRPRH